MLAGNNGPRSPVVSHRTGGQSSPWTGSRVTKPQDIINPDSKGLRLVGYIHTDRAADAVTTAHDAVDAAETTATGWSPAVCIVAGPARCPKCRPVYLGPPGEQESPRPQRPNPTRPSL